MTAFEFYWRPAGQLPPACDGPGLTTQLWFHSGNSLAAVVACKNDQVVETDEAVAIEVPLGEGTGLPIISRQDHQVIKADQAIAVGVPGTLVTDNRRDFPPGEVRDGILILGSVVFLDALYRAFPDAPAAIDTYLGRERSG